MSSDMFVRPVWGVCQEENPSAIFQSIQMYPRGPSMVLSHDATLMPSGGEHKGSRNSMEVNSMILDILMRTLFPSMLPTPLWGKVLLCSTEPRIHYVAQTGLRFMMILLLLLPE